MKLKHMKNFTEYIREKLNISGVISSKINEGKMPYVWYIKTKEFDRIPFYLSDSTINPLEEIEEFDKGDYWEVDCRIDTGDFYKESPYDNSFVLIPKSDVIDVWYEKN